MDLSTAVDFVLHVDDHLREMIRDYGTTTYAILFAIIFAETGLVVTPFLPGDSLLFAAGVFARPEHHGLNVWILFPLLALAAIIGDGVNYYIGKVFGEKLFRNEKSKIFKRSHLDKTHAFFEKHGGKTIVIARFVPIVRTFAPFVAGMGAMSYRKFFLYNVVGAILWVGICVFLGYFFGGLSIVKNNFSLVALAIVGLSVLPMIWEIVAHRRAAKKAVETVAEEVS